MRPPDSMTRVARYGQAVLLVGMVSLVLWLLRESLTLANFSLIYMLVVLVTAIRQGTGPSLVVAVLCFLGFNFLLVRPFYTLIVADPRDVLDLILFLLVAIITGQLASYARTQADNAAQRASEQDVLFKLTSAFNQLTDAQAVFRVLNQVLKVDLHSGYGRVLPDSAARPNSDTTLYVLLQAEKKIYGTLAVDLTGKPTPWQLRMVSACAAQASAALQRIELAERAQQSKAFEEADRLKTALLHAVSHDLRTPLTIIKSSADNLVRLGATFTPDQQQEMLDLINTETDQLNQMVEDLLDMSRLDAGVMHLNLDWNSLEEIAGDIAASIWKVHRTERIRMIFPDDLPLVRCDYGLILRALSNIVENNLRYEPQDRQIDLQATVTADEIQLAIVNHGPPIPAEERDRIMEPFYHGKDGHIGLGLAIAKGIIEAHHWRLSVRDTPGGGATFVCSIPRTQEAEP